MMAGAVLVFAVALSSVATWAVVASYRAGADLLPELSFLLLGLMLFGFAWGISRFGAFSVQAGVMTFEVPIYLGHGHRIRSLALDDIDYAQDESTGDGVIKLRIVLKDSAHFWISSAGLGPDGPDFLRTLLTLFPPKP